MKSSKKCWMMKNKFFEIIATPFNQSIISIIQVAGTILFHQLANCLSTHTFAKQQLATPTMKDDCKSDSFCYAQQKWLHSCLFRIPSSKVMDNKCTQESLQNVTARVWKLSSSFQLFFGSFPTFSNQNCLNRTDSKVVLLKSVPLVAINCGVHVLLIVLV